MALRVSSKNQLSILLSQPRDPLRNCFRYARLQVVVENSNIPRLSQPFQRRSQPGPRPLAWSASRPIADARGGSKCGTGSWILRRLSVTSATSPPRERVCRDDETRKPTGIAHHGWIASQQEIALMSVFRGQAQARQFLLKTSRLHHAFALGESVSVVGVSK